MPFNLDSIKLENDKVSEGVWSEPEPGLRLKVRAIEYPPYKAYLAKLLKPQRGAMRRGGIPMEKLDEAGKKAAAKFLIVDWEPFTVGDKTLSFSQQTAYALFNSHDEFYRIVQEIAEEQGNFKLEEFQDSAGNSQASSDGDISGDAGKTS